MKFFSKSLGEKNEIFNNIRYEHEHWKQELQKMNKPFFMIPTDFSHLFLKDISGGALKLYLFLGFHSKYRSGESWYASEQIANFFEKDPRTVAGWFNELEKLGLIYRAQKGIMMKANTFLKPYGFSILDENCYLSPSFEQINSTIEKFIEEGNSPEQAIILNSGIAESNLIIIFKNINSTNKIYNVCCYFDLDFSLVKKVWSKSRFSNIPIENFEINTPLAYNKFSTQSVYSHIINFYDEKIFI